MKIILLKVYLYNTHTNILFHRLSCEMRLNSWVLKVYMIILFITAPILCIYHINVFICKKKKINIS